MQGLSHTCRVCHTHAGSVTYMQGMSNTCTVLEAQRHLYLLHFSYGGIDSMNQMPFSKLSVAFQSHTSYKQRFNWTKTVLFYYPIYGKFSLAISMGGKSWEAGRILPRKFAYLDGN
ncbi:hypothetical protein HOLleu_18435 [Holothuria leucospilota]|uniref:Uncharacterized protein n=1 Tax=Holothuria leucospilota TaxID=206669 RepID=A0A9Q1C2T4_HOLLE|nr:hypothetical protein HOLleu_18435 [Holothuria leucospilota]